MRRRVHAGRRGLAGAALAGTGCRTLERAGAEGPASPRNIVLIVIDTAVSRPVLGAGEIERCARPASMPWRARACASTASSRGMPTAGAALDSHRPEDLSFATGSSGQVCQTARLDADHAGHADPPDDPERARLLDRIRERQPPSRTEVFVSPSATPSTAFRSVVGQRGVRRPAMPPVLVQVLAAGAPVAACDAHRGRNPPGAPVPRQHRGGRRVRGVGSVGSLALRRTSLGDAAGRRPFLMVVDLFDPHEH